jgi:hypothetical protein
METKVEGSRKKSSALYGMYEENDYVEYID